MLIYKKEQEEYLEMIVKNEEISYDIFTMSYRAARSDNRDWVLAQSQMHRKLCIGISCVEDAVIRRHVHAAMKHSSNGFCGDYDFVPEEMLYVFNLKYENGYIYYIDPNGEKGEFDEYLELMK